MLVDGEYYQSIWREPKTGAISIIDQRWLPHEFSIQQLSSTQDAVIAIRDMWVRGAPLIGVTAAYGLAIAMAEDPSDSNLKNCRTPVKLCQTHSCKSGVGYLKNAKPSLRQWRRICERLQL